MTPTKIELATEERKVNAQTTRPNPSISCFVRCSPTAMQQSVESDIQI